MSPAANNTNIKETYSSQNKLSTLISEFKKQNNTRIQTEVRHDCLTYFGT